MGNLRATFFLWGNVGTQLEGLLASKGGSHHRGAPTADIERERELVRPQGGLVRDAGLDCTSTRKVGGDLVDGEVGLLNQKGK